MTTVQKVQEILKEFYKNHIHEAFFSEWRPTSRTLDYKDLEEVAKIAYAQGWSDCDKLHEMADSD